MKKKLSWLFAIFIALIITGLCVALTFLPEKEENQDINNDIVEEDNNENDDNSEEPTITYATSFTVNLPNTINIQVGKTAKLLNGYVQVNPSETINQIKTEIKPRYNCSAFGLELNNSILSAKEVGTYNLTLSVPRSETSTFNKTILITVYEEEENSHIIIKNNTLVKGERTNISDLFDVDGVDFNVLTDGKISYADKTLTAVTVGTSKIVISFTENYVEYLYEFDIILKDQPIYSIILIDIINNTIEIDLNSTSVYYINYDIENREQGGVTQGIIATIEDDTVAYVEDNTYPLIKIRGLKAGVTTITLICKDDNSVQIEVTIVVK